MYLGGLFSLVLSDRELGPNKESRCAWLWPQIQSYYETSGSEDRLHDLTVSMIQPRKKSIELSGNGAQIRKLIPFAKLLVESWGTPSDLERFAAQTGMKQLARCYEFLGLQLGEKADTLKRNALAFHATVQGLHTLDPARWQLRPKMHMFLELCCEEGSPASSWNYRDESFGGSLARQGHHRGGFSSPLSMSKTMLIKFCAKEALPKLQR